MFVEFYANLFSVTERKQVLFNCQQNNKGKKEDLQQQECRFGADTPTSSPSVFQNSTKEQILLEAFLFLKTNPKFSCQQINSNQSNFFFPFLPSSLCSCLPFILKCKFLSLITSYNALGDLGRKTKQKFFTKTQ